MTDNRSLALLGLAAVAISRGVEPTEATTLARTVLADSAGFSEAEVLPLIERVVDLADENVWGPNRGAAV